MFIPICTDPLSYTYMVLGLHLGNDPDIY